jgi:hypothetical protein
MMARERDGVRLLGMLGGAITIGIGIAASAQRNSWPSGTTIFWSVANLPMPYRRPAFPQR